jgi:hypothetical protein
MTIEIDSNENTSILCEMRTTNNNRLIQINDLDLKVMFTNKVNYHYYIICFHNCGLHPK